MLEIAEYVGNRIRYLRKQQKMTSEMLAAKIGKSRSMISKYESGRAAVDLITLEKIAKALGVSLSMLVEYPEEEKKQKQFSDRLFGSQQELFLYYYDGRREEVMKSYLVMDQEEKEREAKIRYYLGVSEYEHYEESDFIYKGVMKGYDFVTYFSLSNRMNPVDQLSICVLNPLHQNQITWGILFALLSNPIAPYAVKVLAARQMLSDTELTKQRLSFTKEEMKRIRKYNMIYVDHEE
ncbi:MAG: helix-turn-helix transcriptional regulator [Lachnospiraceae bacterium]|nr:helix-turn-helix transcriptional regulator [Lachnospiraceae bacterium]